MTENTRLVYSTGVGRIRICKRCHEPEDRCVCKAERRASSPPLDGFLRIALDRKGRGGKPMTTITGASGDEAQLQQLTRDLKRMLATGGTVRDGVIELQGDHRDRVEAHLRASGYRTKRVGG